MAQINLKVLTDIKQSKKQLEALVTSVDSISKSLSNVSVNPKLTAQINALTNHYKAVAKAAEKVAKVNYNNEIQSQKLAKATAQANKAIADEATAIEKSKKEYAKHQKAVNDDVRAQEKHEVQMKKSTEQLKKSAKETEKHSQSIVSMIPNIIKWRVAMTAVMLPLRKMQEALESVNETLVETEKRVVALRRVAGDAANADELYKLAQKYGQTFDNVADVVENLVKSGYTWEESLKAAEPALLAINVAELDATQATEGLIAVVKQYGLELEDLNYIQGVLNKTADNAAVTTEKLLIALQKTGSTAKNANISFEETVGLITALSEGTAASGQNIGNALRSLIVFTSDSKALDKFAGLSSDMAETVKNYRAGQASILDIWQGLGGELQGMNSQKGTLEDLFGGAELSADIEAQLTQITDSFAEIYGTAGNYRQNYFIALLDNIAKVEDATKDLSDATSYSQKENEKYLDTYESKVNSLKATWQEMANDEQGFLSFKKSLVDMANGFLWVEKSLGGVRTMAVSVATVMATMFGEKIMSGFKDLGASLTALRGGFKKTETAAMSLNAKLGIIGIIATVITAAAGAIDAAISKNRDNVKKSAEEEAELVKSAHDASDAYSDTAKKISEYAEKVEELRRITDDTSSSTEDVATAQAELALIQSELTKNTDTYAGKIDLVNGKLQDQLKYVKELEEQELKANAQKFLDENAAAIAVAESAVNSSSPEKSDLIISTNAFRHGNNRDIINSIISGSGVSDNVSGRFSMGAPIVGLDPWKDAYDALVNDGVNAAIDELIKAPLEGDTYAGSSDAKLMLSGTTEEKIDALKKMIAYVNSNYKDLGITSEESAGIIAALNAELMALDTDDYRSSVDLAEKAQIYKDYLSGIITEEEFLEKIYGITKETVKETKNWGNSLNLTEDTLNEVVSKLKDARDATKESYEYEEKRKAVLEAEEALRKAQESRTVRVYNAKTGRWEQVVNEKDVESARERLEEARFAVEREAYDTIIMDIERGNATSRSILNTLAKFAYAYGTGDFSAIKNDILSILQDSGITINEPSGGGGGKPFTKVQLYDNGGVLYGLGGIKATSSAESVLDPDMTRKVLSPVSNKEFDTFVKDLGLLFGTASAYSQGTPIYHKNTSSDSHDSHYQINGVPIPTDIASRFTLSEIANQLSLIPS